MIVVWFLEFPRDVLRLRNLIIQHQALGQYFIRLVRLGEIIVPTIASLQDLASLKAGGAIALKAGGAIALKAGGAAFCWYLRQHNTVSTVSIAVKALIKIWCADF